MALIDAYNAQATVIRAGFLQDLVRVWPLLDFNNLDSSLIAWAPAVAALTRRDRQAMIGLASAYIVAERQASGVGGKALVIPASTLIAEQFASALLSTTLAGYRTALRTRPPEAAKDVAFVRTAGSLSRLMFNGGRETATESLKQDPKGTGWARVTSPGACDFCRLLEGRGAVYSAETARFSAHDHCKCSARAVYGDVKVPVLPFEPSKRNLSVSTKAKNNARAREFIRAVL